MGKHLVVPARVWLLAVSVISATLLTSAARANKTRFHMRDGPAQKARDAEWGRAADRSPDALRWLYDYDAGTVETVAV